MTAIKGFDSVTANELMDVDGGHGSQELADGGIRVSVKIEQTWQIGPVKFTAEVSPRKLARSAVRTAIRAGESTRRGLERAGLGPVGTNGVRPITRGDGS